MYGASFIRVDVPDIGDVPGFTKYFGSSAIYAITPTTAEITRQSARRLDIRPVALWVVPDPKFQSWGTETRFGNTKPSMLPPDIALFYRADGEGQAGLDRWRPSIFMPRWTSRLTLKITDIRVEQVQDISLADIVAEGVSQKSDVADHYRAWRALWDGIYKKRGDGWRKNPWVWVVEFSLIGPGS